MIAKPFFRIPVRARYTRMCLHRWQKTLTPRQRKYILIGLLTICVVAEIYILTRGWESPAFGRIESGILINP